MTNRPPNINPNGTRYKHVRVWGTAYGHTESSFTLYCNHPALQLSPGTLSKMWKNMMKVCAEYMRADYVVTYEEYYDVHKILWADLTCKPPP